MYFTLFNIWNKKMCSKKTWVQSGPVHSQMGILFTSLLIRLFSIHFNSGPLNIASSPTYRTLQQDNSDVWQVGPLKHVFNFPQAAEVWNPGCLLLYCEHDQCSYSTKKMRQYDLADLRISVKLSIQDSNLRVLRRMKVLNVLNLT